MTLDYDMLRQGMALWAKEVLDMADPNRPVTHYSACYKCGAQGSSTESKEDADADRDKKCTCPK